MLSPASNQDMSSRGHYRAFLHRAAHDPRFLDALEADPQAALAEFGLSVDSEQIPARVTPPSAESILDVLIDVEAEDKRREPTDIKWFGFLTSASVTS